MIGLTDDRATVIRAADKRDALNKAHVAAGGSLCCVCGALLVGRDICPHHLMDTVPAITASEIGERLNAAMKGLSNAAL